jgi:pyruvate dehydrogenase E2 component (dihydrolipoamide acetyltransferase)
MKKEIKIPDIAENVEKGIVAGILVSEGDNIEADQSVVEIETDKATTDIPSPFRGIVAEIKVEEGDEVQVDQVIMIIETESGDKKEEKEKQKEIKEEATGAAYEKGKDTDDEKKSTEKESATGRMEPKKDLSNIPAAPSVRRLAREMDVDLTTLKGTGPGQRITREDVKKHSEQPETKAGGYEKLPEVQLPDFSQWGSTTREPMSNIRKITSKNVQQSWQNIPHVTQFGEADITRLENFRKQHQEKTEKKGGKLTVTAILVKITGFALQKFPRFNASIDPGKEEIIYKHYYNVGVAVDTQKGLLVPVIRDVNRKSLTELSVELTELAKKARDKKAGPDELQGGNFTISNLGGIGGTAFTPIVLPPQVAILGVARSQYKQVFKEGDFQKRLIIPLSLSYDHRAIDGADGARFLQWICDVIEDPYSLLQ